MVQRAIRATRGAFHDAASARAWARGARLAAAPLRGRSLVYFNGAFSPPTLAHAHIAASLCAEAGAEALWIDPEPARPGKERWQDETLQARVAMCEVMVDELGLSRRAGVGTLRRDLGPARGASAELFRALRALLGGPGEGRLVWALGADVFEGMRHWAEEARACLQPGVTCDGVCVFPRATAGGGAAAALGALPCEVRVLHMPEHLLGMSSRLARASIAQCAAGPRGATAAAAAAAATMTPRVAAYCLSRPDVCSVYAAQAAEERQRRE